MRQKQPRVGDRVVKEGALGTIEEILPPPTIPILRDASDIKARVLLHCGTAVWDLRQVTRVPKKLRVGFLLGRRFNRDSKPTQRTQLHLVMGRIALCGAQPKDTAAGWSYRTLNMDATCKRCLSMSGPRGLLARSRV